MGPRHRCPTGIQLKLLNRSRETAVWSANAHKA